MEPPLDPPLVYNSARIMTMPRTTEHTSDSQIKSYTESESDNAENNDVDIDTSEH